MDAIDTNITDIAVIDDAASDLITAANDSFGKEIAKTLTISAATTAGTIVGVMAVGFAVGKFQQIKAKRAAKKAEPEVYVVTDLPETPQTESN